MAEQQPASEQMRELAGVVVMSGRGLMQRLVDQEPESMSAFEQMVERLRTLVDALYTRMQAEEQEREQMRGLLEAWAETEPVRTSLGVIVCYYCAGNGPFSTSSFTHATDCPWLQARTLLAKEG